jgi:N-acetylglucosaminyldiphosphoundecaprenol N-acetyl-beta-D-mannosaminyltransferase
MTSAPERIAALFRKMERPADAEAGWARLCAALEEPGVRVVSFLNAHAVNLSARNEIFFAALTKSDHLLRDGSGVRLGCRIFGLEPGPNMNGTDLIPLLLERFKDRKIALFGTERRWLEQAVQTLRARGIENLLAADGYRIDEHYLALVQKEQPRLIVLGMGMPKQELLALRLKAAVAAAGGSASIVNGGAILDFLGQKVPRAPGWMRRVGLEWLYRLWREPKRLARRYLIGNLAFLWHVLRTRRVFLRLSGNEAGVERRSTDETASEWRTRI